ncbi:putative mitochondrial hypothetical protein [Leptomonas pyrrhocoris]|uniref:SET domain-containing protein n=1 Tax=Leptomonas pyrrhocoris TaxID=157538 RepID=A0A0M9FYK2_LEPPY|nr:putative mitochondrial hypothetical protein [Leptomonas pyrrhocoris]KPA78613.1 putative mitochondrial hypothetical protein [Leptomonas pyrrhocoris]|eukprot:XP_015657052.1 putative mitochondrial hypothetical protein [Leptomonas pyrrhocoris]
MRRRWGVVEEETPRSATVRTHEPVELPWTPVRGWTPPLSSTFATPQQQKQPSTSTLWLRPRGQDVAVVQSAIRDLKLLVSPLLLLAPPPYVSTQARETSLPPPAAVEQQQQRRRPTSYEECSRWYATQPIPAGMFLLSIPTEAVLFANPPPASDPLLGYFMQVEELVAQLVDAAATGGTAHHGYASYLCDSVVPCRNLPFLTPADLQKEFSREAAAASGGEAGSHLSSGPPPPLLRGLAENRGQDESDSNREASASDSPAISLLSFFHDDMSGEPLSDYLRARLSKAEYAWWVSLVLSHRAGSSSLLPMLDKLNHSPIPNCYYTMATEETVCGLDVMDNLLAGVPEELLYQPYVHLFAMRDIKAGEELTLCYASAAEGVYRPAGVHPPPRPASLRTPPPPEFLRSTVENSSGSGEDTQRAAQSTENVSDFMESLFSSAAVAAAATATVPAIGSAADRTDVSRELRHLQHPGRQEVSTAEGSASWRLQWGFVPPCDAVYSAKDLVEMAALVAERRVDTRAALFPPPSHSSLAAAAHS